MVNPFVVFELRACIKDVECGYSLSTELAGFKLKRKTTAKKLRASSNWLFDIF